MKKILLFYCLILPFLINGQPVIFGDLQQYVDDIISGMPGSSGNQFNNLSPSQEADWRALFELIVEEKFAEANNAAMGLQYKLSKFIDNTAAQNKQFYLLEKTSTGANFWGTYVFKPDACRKLVIQCPHPKVDSNTGNQGIFVYKDLNAYAYFLTGTHRCNHQSPSGCSGSTAVCGSSAPYRRSDVAHNTASGFHIASEVLFDLNPELYFVHIHGFAKQASDPFVIMSNGSRDTPTPDRTAEIRDGLFAADPTLTFKIGHLDLAWDRLLAFTNTQGRYINSSSDACTQNANNGNGHFIHIEQEFSKLRAGEQQWLKMFSGLESAFPCGSVATHQLDKPVLLYQLQYDQRIKFSLPESQNYSITFYNWQGQKIGDKHIDANEVLYAPWSSGFFVVKQQGQLIIAGKY